MARFNRIDRRHAYPGVTIKIRWCVRVRAFLRRGKEVFFEQSFVLGDLPPARVVEEVSETQDAAEEVADEGM